MQVAATEPLVGTAVAAPSGWLVVGMLALTLLAIWSCAWLAKRWLKMQSKGQAKGLRLVSSLALSHKEKLAVIQVGEEQVLIGITAGQINHLHTLRQPLQESEEPAELHPFQRKLQQMLTKDAT